ncbi:MAG: response regulator [Deltaproteobacteria bacterium]|nr:response regulator [Deltaproteobacteria bacterium]
MDTVLIIETDSDTIDSLSQFLGLYGYVVDAVDDIETARQKVVSTSPRLVVIGPQLGKSTGFLACSLIKKTPQAKKTPCVLLYTEREEGQVQRHQSLAGRAEVYLRKPFELEQFRAAVAEYLPMAEPPAGPGGDVVEEEIVGVPVVEEDGPPIVEEEVVGSPVVLEEMIGTPAGPSAEEQRLRHELERAEQEARAAREELKRAKEEALATAAAGGGDELEKLRSDVSRLEKQLELAQKQAKEATEASTAAKGKGGSDTRQILELKQTLNKRESELVDLRETSLQKDRQLVDLKDKLFEHEKKGLEYEDQLAERDREIGSLKGQVEALTADKEVAGKRTDDLGRRLKAAEENLKKAKDDAEAQRVATEQALREKDEAHAAALQRARDELTAAKDQEREAALGSLRAEAAAEREAALEAAKVEFEKAQQEQQSRHDSEVYEIQERFRRAMNQQEEKLNAERVRALEEAQQRHDGQVAELVTEHEREIAGLRAELADRDGKLGEANKALEERVAEIARLTEERDELGRRRDALDGELKTSQVAAEHLRMELEGAQKAIAGLEQQLAELRDLRDQLRGKLEADLARVDKSKQAVAVALELLNEVEPL